jgi:tryptophan 7-halogenase
MIQRILVLGGGSAGMLAAATCKLANPQVEVILLRSSAIGIIGVGEGTIPTVPLHLHDDLEIDLTEFYREVKPSWKLGIRYLWGPRPYFNYSFEAQVVTKYQSMPRANGFYCADDMEYAALGSAMMTHDRAFERQANGAPQFVHNVAYHLENEKLVAYLEKLITRVGVVIREGTVRQVEQDEQGIRSLLLDSGEQLAADFFIDSSGFRSLLLGEALGEPYHSFESSLFCDRAVVGGWPRSDEPIKPYTTSETMDSGWCWQIEHQDRLTRGYVYSSAFVDDATAEAEFRGKNPKIEETRLIRFKTGRYENSWVKNVVAVGNAAGFVEPLESTALGMICTASQGLARSLRECQLSPGQAMRDAFNRRFQRSWDVIRAFLAMHYKFNTRLDTPFWQACRGDTDLAGGEPIVEYYQENGPSTIWRDALTDNYDLFNLDGWFALLVGMQVPHRANYQAAEQERITWGKIQQAVRRKAEAGMTCEEAFRIIYSPTWRWNPDFYKGVRS